MMDIWILMQIGIDMGIGNKSHC